MRKENYFSLENLKGIAKDHFFTGVVVLAPLLIVLVVFQWLFGGLVDWIDHVPLNWLVDESSNSALRALMRYLLLLGVLALGYVCISAIGFTSKFYLGKQIWKLIGEFAGKIPVLGAIYGSLDQLIRTLSSSGSKQFSRVVYVEFPRKEVWVVGFVTGPVQLKGFSEGYLNVFVPAVPNPTSGFHMLVKESEVRDSGLRVDEAFKLILSLGVAQPGIK